MLQSLCVLEEEVGKNAKLLMAITFSTFKKDI